jgi:transcription initiation factor TFIID subunit TAF12
MPVGAQLVNSQSMQIPSQAALQQAQQQQQQQMLMMQSYHPAMQQPSSSGTHPMMSASYHPQLSVNDVGTVNAKRVPMLVFR